MSQWLTIHPKVPQRSPIGFVRSCSAFLEPDRQQALLDKIKTRDDLDASPLDHW
jgi:hypothetical protein